MRNLIASGLMAVSMAACLPYGQDAYREQIVVESWQTADSLLAPVKLSRTVPFGETYDFATAAVTDADVRIEELAADGSVAATFVYLPTAPGVYTAADPGARLRPATRYRLRADMPGRATLTAETTVPDTFRVVRRNADVLAYQGPVQFEADLSRSFYPGRQNIYIISTEAADPRRVNLVPLYAQLAEEEDDLDDLRRVSSGLINEGNYEVNADNTITLRFPWIAVAFYGENTVTFHTVDDNVYDFIRSATVQLGGGTTSPGEIENVIDHVENGIGIFGSTAAVKLRITVTDAVPAP